MIGLDLICKGEPRPFSAGIHDGVDRAEYDAISALNCSTLKKWIDLVVINGGCPKKFGHWLRSRKDETKSDALITGSAVDCLILEPEAFEKKFIVLPDDAPKKPTSASRSAFAKGSKQKPEIIESIRWWDAFEKKAGGKDILDAGWHAEIVRMAHAVMGSELTADVFQYCKKRVLQAELNGIPCKGEVDLFSDQTEYVFDLKTARDASLKPFSKAAWELGYHYQAAFYLKLAQACGLKHKTAFCFVVVENVEPYCVAAYTIDFNSDSLQYAWKMIQAAGPSLFHHLKRNLWPDFEEFAPIKFPGFAKKEAKDFLEEN